MNFQRCSLWTVSGAVMLVVLLASAAISSSEIKDKFLTGAPSWSSLYGVAIRPNGSVYIVGSKGLLMVSDNRGKSWDMQTRHERLGNLLYQYGDLNAISFAPDGNSAWIVGEEGIILHSDDGGKNWESQKSGVTTKLFNTSVVDAQHAYACGEKGLLLSTSDGGQNWKSYKYKDNVTLFDLVYTDTNNGWAVGEFETILRTSDGGKTWNLSHGSKTGDFTIGPFFSIVFTDFRHALAAGLNGDVVTTVDGGKSWTEQKLPDTVATYAAAKTGARLWLGGQGGRLVGIDASGKWMIKRPTFNDISGVAFSGSVGYAVGLSGTILRTFDAGEQWQLLR